MIWRQNQHEIEHARCADVQRFAERTRLIAQARNHYSQRKQRFINRVGNVLNAIRNGIVNRSAESQPRYVVVEYTSAGMTGD